MKKKLTQAVHSTFRLPLFERMLKSIVKDKYVDSVMAKFVPPNYTYTNPTYRSAVNGNLKLDANLFDYNDWKAYWGLKEKEREYLYELAGKCVSVVDIGANNGWVLLNIASRIAGHGGFVYGFEPHPDTFNRCLRNINMSGISNCQVYNLGCGEAEGELQMTTVKESNSGQNRIVASDEQPTAALTTVKVTTLDKALNHVQHIDFIKIDVEGFELNVLKGATQILKAFRPVLFVEVDDILLKKNHTSAKHLLSYLKEDFSYTFMNASTKLPINDFDLLNQCHLDVVCFPS